MYRVSKVLLVVLVIAGLCACSATPTRRSFNEGFKDSVVSTKVKFKLTNDEIVKKRNINVDVWRGVVTLTGRVTSPEEKERAEKLSMQVNGVREVDNYLKEVENIDAAPAEMVAKDSTKSTTESIFGSKGNASHPIKTRDVTVSNKVEGPVVFEEDVTIKEKTKYTVERSKYKKPDASNIKEEDLTEEDRLAQEAAEELKRLRGDEE